MACVAVGSLVEVMTPSRSSFDVEDVYLKPVEEVAPGDFVHDAFSRRPVRVTRVLFEADHDARRPLHQVGALRAMGMQWICYAGNWVRMDRVTPPSLERCAGLVALVLEGGKHVRVDGVVCVAYNEMEMREMETTQFREVRVRMGEDTHVKRMAFAVCA